MTSPVTDTSIFRTARIAFDGADAANGSLYLCAGPDAAGAAAIADAVDTLRAAGLWSAQDPKLVRDDQREAYEKQLVFVAAENVARPAADLVLVRCDHPKFPSDAGRFAAWIAALRGRATPPGPR